MPIYEYACPDCGHKFDNLQKFDDPPVTLCPKCGKNDVKKLISATSFVLKGGGWYSDHYGLKSGGGSSESSSASATASAAPSAPAASAPAPAAAPSSGGGGGGTPSSS